MKKITLLCIAVFICTVLSAQKFKLKKGVLTKDKVEIGRVEGSLWKAKDDGIKIFGLNNQLIITIKLDEYQFDNPLYEDYKWYDVKFEDTGKDVMINHLNTTTSSVPAILKNFTKKFDFEFNGSPIQNQDDIIAKYNFKPELEADIKEKAAIDAKYADILNKNEIKRNRLMPIKYKTIQDDGLVTKKIIMQDTININDERNNIIIGSYTKKYKKDLGSELVKEAEYWFMEKFRVPQGDEKLNEYYAAGAIIENSTVVHECKVYTFADQKVHKVKIDNPLKAEEDILNFLLDKGYL